VTHYPLNDDDLVSIPVEKLLDTADRTSRDPRYRDYIRILRLLVLNGRATPAAEDPTRCYEAEQAQKSNNFCLGAKARSTFGLVVILT